VAVVWDWVRVGKMASSWGLVAVVAVAAPNAVLAVLYAMGIKKPNVNKP
jgi:hypothetical protein